MKHKQDTQPSDDRIIIGKVGTAHGLQGWVKINSYTRPVTDIFKYKHWFIRFPEGWKRVGLQNAHPQGKGLIAHLRGCNDRDSALALRNRDIAIERDQLGSLEEDEYYWSDLIGLSVKSAEGFDFGQVDSLIDNGANDVLVVKGDRERLIPFARPEVIKQVNLDVGEMIVDWDPDF